MSRTYLSMVVTLLLGCDIPPWGNLLPQEYVANSGLAAANVNRVIDEVENNNSFSTAQPVLLGEGEGAELLGLVEYASDLDIFLLGAFEEGDTVSVYVERRSGGTTPFKAAVFDGQMTLIQMTGLGDNSGTTHRSEFQVEISEADSDVYLCVTGGLADGRIARYPRPVSIGYRILVHRNRSPRPAPGGSQIVWLEFGGGPALRFVGSSARTSAPFDASRLSERLSGQTDDIIDMVHAHMEEDFAAFDITFLNSARHARPAMPHTTVYFGGLNAEFLGMAENTDWQNRNVAQEAIVFAENLKWYDYLGYSAEDAAQYLANVAGHELGHLLGLVHTSGHDDLMSVWPSVNHILSTNASFGVAPMANDVLPFGVQDSARLLLGTLGAF